MSGAGGKTHVCGAGVSGAGVSGAGGGLINVLRSAVTLIWLQRQELREPHPQGRDAAGLGNGCIRMFNTHGMPSVGSAPPLF